MRSFLKGLYIISYIYIKLIDTYKYSEGNGHFSKYGLGVFSILHTYLAKQRFINYICRHLKAESRLRK